MIPFPLLFWLLDNHTHAPSQTAMTILLDDCHAKATYQSYNHLCTLEYTRARHDTDLAALLQHAHATSSPDGDDNKQEKWGAGNSSTEKINSCHHHHRPPSPAFLLFHNRVGCTYIEEMESQVGNKRRTKMTMMTRWDFEAGFTIFLGSERKGVGWDSCAYHQFSHVVQTGENNQEGVIHK